jgi:hypothetical protein
MSDLKKFHKKTNICLSITVKMASALHNAGLGLFLHGKIKCFFYVYSIFERLCLKVMIIMLK